MIQLLEKKEWCDDFLLPLTGLSKSQKFETKSYLFWNDINIYDYKLILTLSAKNYPEMLMYCKNYVFPVLDKKGYLLENYDIDEKSIFVLDLSEWAMDIHMFIEGKYSKFSKEAKKIIEDYHTFDDNKISIQLQSVLYPNKPAALLDKMTPIEYVAKHYELDLEDMQKIGEIGSTFSRDRTTLVTNTNVYE